MKISSYCEFYDSNRYVISIQEIAIPNSIGICNHDQQSIGTIFKIVWVIFTHWLLLTWVIICCLFKSRQSKQSLYLHGDWNYQEYCVSTSIGKLNILETRIFFFSPIQTNWATATRGRVQLVYIYIYIYMCVCVCVCVCVCKNMKSKVFKRWLYIELKILPTPFSFIQVLSLNLNIVHKIPNSILTLPS